MKIKTFAQTFYLTYNYGLSKDVHGS